MIIDLSEALSQEYDVVIIGAGLAGITLALDLEASQPSIKVLLVEFGGGGDDEAGTNELDDSIRITNLVNHHQAIDCTVKGIGGTSKTWGGRVVSYDDVDFLPRPAIGGQCTWDISLFQEIKGYYDRAAAYLDSAPARFSTHEIPALKGTHISEKFTEGDILDSPLERWSLPTRYGSKFGEHLARSEAIRVLTGTRASRILAEGPDTVGVEVTQKRRRETAVVRGKNYVLAAGAQESTRLLLRSPDVFTPVGGIPDALGKYYQGHLLGKIASVRFTGDPKKTDFGFMMDGDVYVKRRLQAPTDVQLREGLLNCVLWLDNPRYYDPSHRSGAMSFMYLMMITPGLGSKLAPPSMAYSITGGGPPNRPWAHIGNVLRGLPMSVVTPANVFCRRYFGKRRLPGVFLYNAQNEYALTFHGEQIPSEDHRMYLDKDGETLVIDYGFKEVDIDSVIRTHDLLDKWLRKNKSGEVVYWYPWDQLAGQIRANCKDGVHQIGTTRISRTADKGVVDYDLKVWGTNNLYVCSTSAFPTSGHANPTYFMLAFAVRLADRLVGK